MSEEPKRFTSAQARALYARVHAFDDFLDRCRKRLEDRGFDQAGDTCRVFGHACNAVRSLATHLAYEAGELGMGMTLPITEGETPCE